MEILEAFDLCKTARGAAALCGCSHNTVTRYVQLRDQGSLGEPKELPKIIDSHVEKIEEWVDHSKGRVRADVVHDRLKDMDYAGSERTTRRAVAEAKDAYYTGRLRVYRPWITEPGMWFQFDWADGPKIGGRRTCLFCAWLAWSRFRVVIPTWDRTMPTLIWCIDRGLRAFGGVPTYALADNEKTVTTEHIARIPVRNPELVAASRHYGLTVASCVPYDPETKGGSEATVRISKADLVPTDANLLEDYRNFSELEQACREFTELVNNREHKVTRRVPAQMLAIESKRLHPVPAEPYVVAFGETRRVSWSSTICFSGARYSVPHRLAGGTVRARVAGDELVIIHQGKASVMEVARHQVVGPGNVSLKDEHYPPRPEGPLNRTPVAATGPEKAFLDLGAGARTWLVEAAAAGTSRMRHKMAEAVSLARIHGERRVEQALGMAAELGRFDRQDLESILLRANQTEAIMAVPDELFSLQPGTAAWSGVSL